VDGITHSTANNKEINYIYMETIKQKTLKSSFSLSGKGLHTGLNLTVTFNPAPENTGYRIQRIDLEGQPIIDAVAEKVVDTQRGTVLAQGDVRVSTVEHAMAALYALGIDNCLIQVDGPEFPILDGSAIMYVDKIKEVGIEELSATKDWYIIRKKIEIKDEESGSCITILPDDQFSITAMCSFQSKFINSQFATIDRVEDFPTEIAPARTFVFVRDIMPLLDANLIKGGDLENAIVIYERQVTQQQLDNLADLLKVPHMDATKIGYIQPKPLQWENECTRHKLLDIIGDMALIGRPIKGRIVATRPGHTINNKFARLMRKEIKKHEVQAPIYDPNQEPVMDNIRIRQLLPHRYPMQLVDKVIAMGPTSIVGVKNITANEPFFTGHFPEEPVMPGVLQVEAMAQCGGLLVLSQVDEPERWSTYFMRIDEVKFRQKVVPGDTLLFRVELLHPVRHGVSTMKGYVFVGDHVVSEAQFTAQIVKNK
jgi:UDP-3-O-[3-hydroxymyristoyl] N-acetylglucosamine deacetylase/3-hydroxyacyl-[acyl-carrier-protein] dehydratase